MEDSELAARAAWLHYAGGLTQSAIAERFGIPVTRAHRMIARAAKDGLVRVFVDAEVAGCVALEEALKARFGLSACIVAPSLAEASPLRAIGIAAARMLTGVLERRAPAVIGIGHGRTLSMAVDQLPALDARGFRFVSLLGGLTRSFAANPYDVIHRLTARTGAEGFLVPAPLFANTPEDQRTLMAQTGLAEIGKLWREAEICLLGVGAVDPQGSIAQANVFDPEDKLSAIRAEGARAEVLGQFLDAEGRRLPTRYDGRLIAADLFDLRGREVIAVAGGEEKAAALDACLRSGVFTGLITDEATARRLAGREAEAGAASGLAEAGV
jgi:DNA-binding transcriptional regulator LsrR (DeoR family)